MANFPILEHFSFAHLPERLREASRPFCELAERMAAMSGENPASAAETAAGLRKLLEAKDCAVRALVVSTRGVSTAEIAKK